MNHLDLFTGIMGFAYAAKAVWGDDYKLVATCEKDKFCQKLIRKRAPGVPVFADIRTLNKDDINEPIDLITGGFPCQPFSTAGKQKGRKDDRYLWEEMLRVIKIFRPPWVVGENVTGIIQLALDDVLSSLEAEGYITETYIIPACAVGAPHIRERVWIVGHSNDADTHSAGCKKQHSSKESERSGFRARFSYPQWEKHWVEVAARFCRVDDGIPHRVDRLRALGNAIVPQVAMAIFEAIRMYELNKNLFSKKKIQKNYAN